MMFTYTYLSTHVGTEQIYISRSGQIDWTVVTQWLLHYVQTIEKAMLMVLTWNLISDKVPN